MQLKTHLAPSRLSAPIYTLLESHSYFVSQIYFLLEFSLLPTLYAFLLSFSLLSPTPLPFYSLLPSPPPHYSPTLLVYYSHSLLLSPPPHYSPTLLLSYSPTPSPAHFSAHLSSSSTICLGRSSEVDRNAMRLSLHTDILQSWRDGAFSDLTLVDDAGLKHKVQS